MKSYLPLSENRYSLLFSLNEHRRVEGWASSHLLGWGRTSGFARQVNIHDEVLGDRTQHIITDLGRLVLRLHGEHVPTLRSRVLGQSPIAGGGPIYGAGLRCTCGKKFQNNERPASPRGNTVLKQEHRAHVQEAFEAAREAAA